jgi:hypothetical protein
MYNLRSCSYPILARELDIPQWRAEDCALRRGASSSSAFDGLRADPLSSPVALDDESLEADGPGSPSLAPSGGGPVDGEPMDGEPPDSPVCGWPLEPGIDESDSPG